MQLKELFEKVDALKAEIDKLRPLKPEDEQRIMQKFRLDWNYHSNAIEGNSLTLGETRAFLLEGLTADGKPIKDHLDIRGHDNLIDYLVEYIRRREELTEKDIRGMHQILLHEPYETDAVTPDGRIARKLVRLGEYKTTPNAVRTGTGQIIQYTPPEDVPPKMHELIEWHRKECKSSELHPVAHAAIFQHRFLQIHPFDDGNGRLGRILMNLILMRHGFPPVVIKLLARERYVAALRKADAGETGDIVSFVGECLLDAETLYLRGAGGESIEDSDDVEKQVALLRQQLSQVPKPVELTSTVQSAFLAEKLTPLLDRIERKLIQFDEFFRTSIVDLRPVYEWGQAFSYRVPRLGISKRVFNLHAKAVVEKPPLAAEGSGNFRSLEIIFVWEEFLRDGTNDFSVRVGFSLEFDKNKFRVMCDAAGLNETLLYQTWLTEDQLNHLVSSLAKNILGQIEAGLARNRPK